MTPSGHDSRVGAVMNRLTSSWRAKDRDTRGASVLFGSGRSGTTWLLQELVRLTAARPIFEPFHPIEVQRSGEVVPRGYLPPGTRDETLRQHVGDVLAGRFDAPWLHQCVPLDGHSRTDARVIKEIHSHLWGGWLQAEFPQVPMAVVVRHPLAQVGSRSALAWTDAKLDRILADERLIEEHAPNLPALAASAASPLERGVLLWAIDNRVLLRTLAPRSVFLFGYEEAVAEPQVVGDLVVHLGHQRPADDALASHDRERASVMSQPGSPARSAGDENAKWLAAARADEVGRALGLLEELGLGGVFGAGGDSDMDAFRQLYRAGLH
ncbi:hypothetical protein [Demequina sp. NBRC 110053]|uniref:hypothetical protein n=1 Tax=Demequina sp. NBRC 110053 TaxID=1570342 RepID=UPI0009FBA218|nr:hypothetical protein [Demequina sp. NBRC 110053]